MRKYIAYGVTCLLITLGSFAFLGNMYLTQETVIFQQKTLDSDYVFHWDLPVEEVFLPVGQNEELHGIYLQHPQSKGAILYLHGRNKHLGNCEKMMKLFYDKGYSVFGIDYRGFGKSTNNLSEKTLLDDAEYAYSYLQTRCPQTPISVYGESLGTAMAIWCAKHPHTKQLILEAPFESLLSMAVHTKKYIPKSVLSKILKYHIRSDQWIKQVSAPITIFHGTNDRLIPIEQSYNLAFHAHPDTPVELVVIEGWDHRNFYKNAQYCKKLHELLL